MIASPDEVICPACGGQPEPGETCWPCRSSGMVEAWRVCPGCGRFNDFCICHLRLEQNVVTLPSKTGTKGVYLNAAHNSYIVSVSRDHRQIFLGEFPAEMLDLAKACRAEADDVAADDLPTLRVKYGKLRAERGGRNFVNRGKKNGRADGVRTSSHTEPRSDSADWNSRTGPGPSLADLAADQSPNDLTEPNTPPDLEAEAQMCEEAALKAVSPPNLADLIAEARAADAQMHIWEAQATEARFRAQEARESAVAAWQAVVAELQRLGTDEGSALWLTELGNALNKE